MEIANVIRKIGALNRRVSFSFWRARVGCVAMALFLIFALGEKVICRFVPMEPATADFVSEAMSCIACLILGEELMMSLYRLTPRRRWSSLLAMIGGFAVGLIIAACVAYFDGNIAEAKKVAAILCIAVVLMVAAAGFWWSSVRRLKRIRFERALERQRRRRSGY